MFDRLATPWGLVRAGVAPDHPKIKAVTRVYEKTAAQARLPLPRQRRGRRDVTTTSCRRTTTPCSTPSARRPTGGWASPARTCPAATPPRSSWPGTTATPTTPTTSSTCRPHARRGRSATATSRSTSRACSRSRREELRATDIADHALEALARERDRGDRRRRPARARAGRVHEPRAARAGRDGRRRRRRRSRGGRAGRASRALLESDAADGTTRRNVEIVTDSRAARRQGKPAAHRAALPGLARRDRGRRSA